ncbi:MAG: hypothetical protein Q9N32_07530 [Gammaproteobacteria bacterium]|nr:hypothetical protein [Gammaproteobacteria bacterium]
MSDIFATLREQDVLLHHPYQSFSPVIDFLKQAAADPSAPATKSNASTEPAQILLLLTQAAWLHKQAKKLLWSLNCARVLMRLLMWN